MPQELNPIIATADMVLAAIESAMEDAVDTQSTKLVLADLCVAHVHANRLFALTQLPRVVDATSEPLPKLQLPHGNSKKPWQKERPGIAAKLKSARDFDCPTCHAEAGTNCFVFDVQGKHGKPTDQRNTGSTYHAKRQALSKVANDRVRAAYDKAQAQAVRA